MNEKVEAKVVEVEELDVIDLGDAAKETRQPSSTPIVPDSPVSWTWFAAE